MFTLLLSAANQIESDYYKFFALRNIAQSAGQLQDGQAAKEVLIMTFSATDQIESDNSKSSALLDIAQAYRQLQNSQAAKELLGLALPLLR